MTTRPFRLVAFANGNYSNNDKLKQSVPDARALAELLQNGHQYETFVYADVDPNGLQLAVRQKLAENGLAGGTLILSWTGHGKTAKNGSLRLIGNFDSEDVELANAADLGEWAAQTGALQILIVIDTCSAGAGLIDAAQLAGSVIQQSNSRTSAWFGVIAASLADEPALSGALSRELRRLLTEGPIKEFMGWEQTREYIRGDDLIQTVREDWTEPRQKPEVLAISSRGWDLVRNPRFERGLPDQVVEHLLQAARGNSKLENFFTGREKALSEIVSWMGKGKPGLLVVSGPPGSGKSAVVGRIVSLSSKEERARILQAGEVPAALDPQEGSVDAHIQARGVTVESAAEELLRRLGLAPADGRFGLLSAAERRRKAGNPLVLAVDGLDEAGAFSRELASELLKPLAQQCLLLVSTRDVISSGQEPLIGLMGEAAERLDLNNEFEGTQRDIHAYVVRRLTGISDAMEPTRVAEELVTGSSTPTSFLLARLVTSQLRQAPVDTSAGGWQLNLSLTVESALERDLQSVVLNIDGKPEPTAARELLQALTLAYGRGFPADDVWPGVATALSQSSINYKREDAYQALSLLGRHLVAGSEGDQPVYRIAHQRLVEHLSADKPGGASADVQISRLSAAATAIFNLYNDLLERGFRPEEHRYLWRYAWHHLADAGEDGLKLLRRLVERDREAFVPLLASGLNLASAAAFEAGSVDKADDYLDEAIRIWRELKNTPKLSTALFVLAMIRMARGDQSGAEAAATEACTLARDLPESDDRRVILAGALLGRAATQLNEGRFKSARLLAEQALALSSGPEPPDSKVWRLRVSAMVVGGKAAVALEDFSEAAELCQQAVDLIDQKQEPDSALLVASALSTLVSVHFSRALRYIPQDAAASIPLASCKAGERLVQQHRAWNVQNMAGKIEIARGIFFVAKALLLDAQRGIDVSHLKLPGLNDIPALIDEIVADTEPYAGRLLDGAVILSYALQFRSLLAVDNSQWERDRSEAINVLRPFAKNSPVVAGALGEILDATTADELSRYGGQLPNKEETLSRQSEAISCLRRCLPAYLPLLAQALSRLASICRITGKINLQKAATTEAVATMRQLIGRTPDAPMRLAELLCEQVALDFDLPFLIMPLANEALALALAVPDSPQASQLIAKCEINVAVCKTCLGDFTGNTDLLNDAIKRLEAPSTDSLTPRTLATACGNLAYCQIVASEFAPALKNARRALKLFSLPSDSDAMSDNIPLARLCEGLALQGTGEISSGSSIVNEVTGKFLTDLRAGRQTPGQVALVLNRSGAAVWDAALASLSDSPDLLRKIKIHRIRPQEEIQLTVQTLIEALESVDSSEIPGVRAIARHHRSMDTARFDAAWRDSAGDLPQWLQLDMTIVGLVILWLNSTSFEDARNYLEEHPEVLSPASNAVLEEIRFSSKDDDLVDNALNTLALAREIGTAAAYAQLLAAHAVNQWLASTDLIGHFNEHSELLGADVAKLAGETAASGDRTYGVLAGILELARRGELEIASKIGDDPVAGTEFLQPAWRSKDVTRLAALASIVRGCTNDISVSRKSTVALAIARVLESRVDAARALIADAREGATQEDCGELIGMISDAIVYYPSSTGALVELIQMLAKTGE